MWKSSSQVLSDSVVESGTDIGPYARLRTNCHIRENVQLVTLWK